MELKREDSEWHVISDLVNGMCAWRTMLSGHRRGIEKARILWSVFRVMRRLGTPEANVLTQVVVKGETGIPHSEYT